MIWVFSVQTGSFTLYDHETGARLLTAKEAAAYLGYHPYSLYRLVLQGDLRPRRRVGRTLLFHPEELDRYKVSNRWAARKAAIVPPVDRPEVPPPDLAATVYVDVGNPLLRNQHESERVEPFTWDQVPLIHARTQERYGRRPSEIRIQSPEGGTWLVTYEPPTWLDALKKKLTRR